MACPPASSPHSINSPPPHSLTSPINATSFTQLGAGALLAHRVQASAAAMQSVTLPRNDAAPGNGAVGKLALVAPMALARAELVGPITIGPCPEQPGTAGLLGNGYKGTHQCVPNLNETLRAEPGVSSVLVT